MPRSARSWHTARVTSRSADSEREAKLLATMLNVLVTGASDQSRLTRGRTYARQGAVIGLEVLPGIITASVQGSRARPYDVTVRVGAAEPPLTPISLVPDHDEVGFTCSCPDWDDPCKHAVAVMIAFADAVADNPTLVRVWRGRGGRELAERAVVGSRIGAAEVPPPAADRVSGVDDTARAALAGYLAAPADASLPELERVAPLAGPQVTWGDLWEEMLADALDHLRDAT